MLELLSCRRRRSGKRIVPWALALSMAVASRAPGPAHAQGLDPTPHSTARLIPAVTSIRPGDTLRVGLLIELDPGWHTYWRNPGDSGSELLLTWRLPAGLTAGPIQWPVPRRFPYPPLMSYGYEGEVLFAVDVATPRKLSPGTSARLEVDAAWLVCQEECLPADEHLTLELPVESRPAAPSPWAGAFTAAARALPVQPERWGLRAWNQGGSLVLGMRPRDGTSAEGLESAYFFASDNRLLEHAAPQPLRVEDGEARLTLARSAYRSGSVDSLAGVLALRGGGGRTAVSVAVAVAGGPPASRLEASSPLSLPGALAFALVGGLLLNLMPCVFPVLSLKVLGFLEQAGGDAGRARVHGVAFAAGVVSCALALAGILLALRAAGAEVGWGFQLQSPVVVAALALLMVAIGLGFLGLFEVGTTLTRLGTVGAGDTRYRGSFFTGALAMVVATPCTAPFMGAAVGAALVRPAAEGLAVFGVLGAGMAAPYLALSMRPALLDRLPRPGPWMETLRQALAFPMFAVGAWLLWVLGLQAGVDAMAAVVAGMLALAFGGWMMGHAHRRHPGPLWLRASATLVILGSLGWTLLHVARLEGAVESRAAATRADGWEPFTPELVRSHRSRGRPVFVDFTAAWCITCQVNERVALGHERVRSAFLARDVALIRADWTRRDPAITRALAEFGRSGVPLYVLYPSRESTPPEVLPTVLTPDLVVEALERLDPGGIPGALRPPDLEIP